MNKIKTAIVILNWNGEKLLPQFLPSVIENSQIPETKIIIADNGSTDNSLEILNNRFPEVDILDLKENHGFAKGYNEALKQIDAEYYVLLNSDVEVSEAWLEPVVNLLDNDDTIGAVQPKILSYIEKNKFEYAGAAGGFIDRWGFPFCRGRILNEIETDKGQYNDTRDIFWGSGACLFIRADLYHKSGGLDADFWAHMEEIDLCWRIKNMGHRIVFCPESKVYHLGGASLPYDNPKKLYLNFRNNLRVLYKNLPAEKLFSTIFIRLLIDALAAFKLLSEANVNGFFSVIRAHLSLYKDFRSLKEKRKAQSAIVERRIHPEIFDGSILKQFYLRKIKRFQDLKY